MARYPILCSRRDVPGADSVQCCKGTISGDAGRYRIEDDGTTIPMIEAEGIDLNTSTRQEALESLLTEYGARYDEEKGELTTAPLSVQKVPSAAFKFVALLLRLQDLILLTPERAAS